MFDDRNNSEADGCPYDDEFYCTVSSDKNESNCFDENVSGETISKNERLCFPLQTECSLVRKPCESENYFINSLPIDFGEEMFDSEEPSYIKLQDYSFNLCESSEANETACRLSSSEEHNNQACMIDNQSNNEVLPPVKMSQIAASNTTEIVMPENKVSVMSKQSGPLSYDEVQNHEACKFDNQSASETLSLDKMNQILTSNCAKMVMPEDKELDKSKQADSSFPYLRRSKRKGLSQLRREKAAMFYLKNNVSYSYVASKFRTTPSVIISKVHEVKKYGTKVIKLLDEDEKNGDKPEEELS